MSDLRKAAEMALEALEWNYGTDLCDIENCMAWLDKMNATIPALRQALAQPEQEPEWIATIGNWGKVEWLEDVFPQLGAKLYSAPLKREWVGLTGEDIDRLTKMHLRAYPTYPGFYGQTDFAKAIDALLKEKNT